MKHHNLDIFPIPKDVLYINEPGMIDESICEERKEPEDEPDNVRIYIPMDLNRNAILRRLGDIIHKYGFYSEANEMPFGIEVSQVISQVEIYDQVWHARHYSPDRKHSIEATKLIEEIVQQLKEIPDHCSECFPFNLIEELETEYLGGATTDT